MGKEESIRQIKNFISKLSKDFKIKKIIFFGSRANEEERENSDLDLIIVSDDFNKMDFMERASKMYDYWNFEVPIDFLCYTEKEFNALSEAISIVREALKRGIVIQ